MTKLTSFLIAGALVAGAASQTFTGIITDSMCGKDHAMMKVTPDSKCVQECVKQGSKYALFDGKNLYVLSDQKTPERFAGQKVTGAGALDEKTKILEGGLDRRRRPASSSLRTPAINTDSARAGGFRSHSRDYLATAAVSRLNGSPCRHVLAGETATASSRWANAMRLGAHRS